MLSADIFKRLLKPLLIMGHEYPVPIIAIAFMIDQLHHVLLSLQRIRFDLLNWHQNSSKISPIECIVCFHGSRFQALKDLQSYSYQSRNNIWGIHLNRRWPSEDQHLNKSAVHGFHSISLWYIKRYQIELMEHSLTHQGSLGGICSHACEERHIFNLSPPSLACTEPGLLGQIVSHNLNSWLISVIISPTHV